MSNQLKSTNQDKHHGQQKNKNNRNIRPSDGLPKIVLNPKSNIIEFKRIAEVWFPAKYGNIGTFFRTFQPFKIPTPVRPITSETFNRLQATRMQAIEQQNKRFQESPELKDKEERLRPLEEQEFDIIDDQEVCDITFRERIRLREKQLLELKDKETEIFNTLLSKTSLESRQRLAEDDEWEAINSSMNPLKLWILLYTTHTSTSSENAELNKERAEQQLHQARMLEGQSLHAWKNYIDECLVRIGAVNGNIPSDFRQAVKFIEGLDKKIYGGLRRDLNNAMELGRESEYPQTLNAAYRLACHYDTGVNTNKNPKHDKKNNNNHNQKKGEDHDNNDSTFVTTSKKGQSKKDKKDSKSESGGQKLKYPCTVCSLVGEQCFDHKTHECPRAIEIKNRLAEGESDNDIAKTLFINSKETTFVTALAENCNKLENSDILLDSCSSINIFHNADLLTDVTKFSPPRTINGLGGDIKAHASGFLLGMKVFVSPQSPANILSLARVEDCYSVDHDSHDGSFKVNIPAWSNPWKFTRRDDFGGLRISVKSTDLSFVTTIQGNLVNYTKKEIQQAELSRELMRRLAYPSDKQLALLINRGAIINVPVTSKDVHRATRIFGPDVASKVGKMTKRKPHGIPVEPIPQWNLLVRKDTTLAIDIFFINQHAFILSLSDIDYLMCAHLIDRASASIVLHITNMIRAYRANGFTITRLHADSESGFIAMRGEIEALGVPMITHAPDQKVVRVERKIRVIKERDRAIRADLPFRLYGTLLVYCTLNIVRCLNLHISSNDTDFICPRERFTGIRTEYRRDLPLGFGDYCLLYNTGNNRLNSPTSRCLHAIALMPTGSVNGDVKFLHLETQRILVRSRFQVMPMPQQVIDFINRGCPTTAPEIPRFRVTRANSDHDVPDNDNDEEDNSAALPAAQEEMIDRTVQDSDTSDHRGVDTESMDDESAANLEDIGDGLAQDANEPITNDVATNITETVNANNNIAEEPPIDEIETRRYPVRSNRTTWRDRTFHVSVRKALTTYKQRALVSIVKEIRSVAIVKQAFIPLDPRTLTQKQLRSIIPSSLFLKEKFKPDGEFEKLKARLVAGGHKQHREEYAPDEITSPTVSTTSVMTNIAIAGIESRFAKSVDIGTAYLNSDTPKDKLILMRINKLEAAILCSMIPTYTNYLREDGTMVVRLTKALYGCIESAKLWYNDLTGFFKTLGFVTNPCDTCVLNKMIDDKVQITVMLHVDDILITCKEVQHIDALIDQLQHKYQEINIQHGPIINYLGMVLNFTKRGECTITMPGFTDDILKSCNTVPLKSAFTPAPIDLFTTYDERCDALNAEDAKWFHSIVMKIMYLAKRARPDLLVAISYLSSRVQRPNVQDKRKLWRIINYLRGTKQLGIKYDNKVDDHLDVYAYVDASYGVHADYKSHTGTVITINGCNVYFRSTKQKINTKSSTEAELVGLSDALSFILHLRNYLIGQGYKVGPCDVLQDNQSTIRLVLNGKSNSNNTRHINIRYFFIHDRLASKEIKLTYEPTESMLADALTKPLQGLKFIHMRDNLLNMRMQGDK